MAIPHPYHLQTRGRATIALSAVLALTGCSGDDETILDETPAEPQEVFNIGVAMSSPGLVSGVNPTEVSGAEVDLAAAVTERMQTLPPGADRTWVPTGVDTVAEELAAGELDLAIGQFSEALVSDDVARVGPYLTVEAGVLIHQEAQEPDAAPLEVLQPTIVDSFDELADASVCVVAGSLAATVEAEKAVTEPSVTECEVGMRSGRYDAILADDVQLAGLLTDPVYAARYELLSLAELGSEAAGEEAAEGFGAALFESRQYWIGASADYCADAGQALEAVAADGVLEGLFGAWDQVEGFQVEPVDPAELTIENCVAED
ncbi:hypothetical protein GCM10023190_08660 [Enteractinococcus fodinae]|uniref:ABC-type amino acid transport substrate-binding protein n=1 Tax=Enteractinococcus fodinae TaxID=684663 RepID=A0ABU2AZ89_9MICC|nr:transporter substrate-binding domain-containing protein [Enteractinococcus fodinae]MDR7346657.1 ABC-type amino acid transport substrate-binding protein [Enteractinococcus fodinae]